MTNVAAEHAASHGHVGSECFSSFSSSTSSSTFPLRAAAQAGESFLSGRFRLKRDPPDRRGLGFFNLSQRPKEQQSWRPRPNSIRHQSIPTSLPHLHTGRDTGQRCRGSLTALKFKRPEKNRGKLTIILCSVSLETGDSRLTLRERHKHSGRSLDRHQESEYLSSLLRADWKMRRSPLQEDENSCRRKYKLFLSSALSSLSQRLLKSGLLLYLNSTKSSVLSFGLALSPSL